MRIRRALAIALAASAGLFIGGMAYVIIRALVGSEPVAMVAVGGAPGTTPRFGTPHTSVPRDGLRQFTITSNDATVPLALKMRLASTGPATFSVRAGDSLRAARPEVVQEGQEFTLPVGRVPQGRTRVAVYARTIPAVAGPPIVLEQIRVAWDATPSVASRVAVWVLLVAAPLFLMLLIIRFAIGPPPDPSAD